MARNFGKSESFDDKFSVAMSDLATSRHANRASFKGVRNTLQPAGKVGL